jgi:hypothetical protein
MERPRIVGKTIADKEAHLASLRAIIAGFQKLAAEHGAAGNDAIAKKLLEVASDLRVDMVSLEDELRRATVSPRTSR